MQQLSTMNPAEVKVPLTWDFSPYLSTGVTLTGTPVIDVALWNNGADADPSTILDGAPSIIQSSTTVLQKVTGATGGSRATGGLDGCDYRIRCRAQTTEGRTIALVSLLPVRNV
jgi:hypothetical protein